MLRIRVVPWALVLTGAMSIGACDDKDTTGPDAEVVAGTYTATRFTVTENGSGSQNILALGGDLTITLNANGTMTASVFAPGFGDDGLDFDEDVSGTWEIDDEGRITFDFAEEVDIFLEDIGFDFDDDNDTLVTTEATSDTAFDIVLSRQ